MSYVSSNVDKASNIKTINPLKSEERNEWQVFEHSDLASKRVKRHLLGCMILVSIVKRIFAPFFPIASPKDTVQRLCITVRLIMGRLSHYFDKLKSKGYVQPFEITSFVLTCDITIVVIIISAVISRAYSYEAVIRNSKTVLPRHAYGEVI